jgi:hypothetical protein
MSTEEKAEIQKMDSDQLRLQAQGFREDVEMELLLKARSEVIASKDITVRLRLAHYERQRFIHRHWQDREKLMQTA